MLSGGILHGRRVGGFIDAGARDKGWPSIVKTEELLHLWLCVDMKVQNEPISSQEQ